MSTGKEHSMCIVVVHLLQGIHRKKAYKAPLILNSSISSGFLRGMCLHKHCIISSTDNVLIRRLFLQDGKYQLVKTPIDIEESKRAQPCLGKSEKRGLLCNNSR